MQTTFSPERLRDPDTARSNEILRSCVHCGFCTATCPTYQVLGDELDSPRGRIYLMKDMLEQGRPADAHTVKHIDRCLSCLACMTTCPSGVHYMHLVDHARAYIEETYKRPPADRALRWMLTKILPYPERFRWALRAAKLGRPFSGLMPDARVRAMMRMAPKDIPAPSPMDEPQTFPAQGPRRKRVALMTGCAQRALNTDINEATIRLLTRHGCEVVIAEGMGCCGALVHHMGRTKDSHAAAERNIRVWMREVEGQGLDAIVINTSGCGTTVKDYGHMLRTEPLAKEAATISGLAKDVSEVMIDLGLNGVRSAPPVGPEPGELTSAHAPEDGKAQGYDAVRTLEADAARAAGENATLRPAGFTEPEAPGAGHGGMRVAYHAACSLQHGQQIKTHPKTLLKAAGFEVVEPRDAHLCCGSAGTYNILQPEISAELKKRKVGTLEEKKPQVIAAGNIGCMMQIGAGTEIPVVHTVELLDWATGGPKPRALARA